MQPSLLGRPSSTHALIQVSRVLGSCLATSGLLSSYLSRGHVHGTASQPLAQPAAAEEAHDAIHVTINGRTVTVQPGTSVLDACSQLGIQVPTLCAHPNVPGTPGTCRVCLVQVGSQLKPACKTAVSEGMEVATDSPAVRESVRGVLAMMQASHPAECMNCESNGHCEFQELTNRYETRELSAKLRSFRPYELQPGYEHQYRDDTSAAISIDFDKCIKCGRCVAACGVTQGMNVLGMQGRGGDRRPGVLTPLELSNCIGCGQCSAVCPVGAITEKSEWRQVMDELDSKRKVLVIMMAPSIRVSIGEEVGLAPGEVTTGQIATAQRMLGFDYVFDANFSADLTIIEEGSELLRRLRKAWGLEVPAETGEGQHEAHEEGPLPMYTSCCPAWINYVEKLRPDLIPHLSTAKSPMGMLGAVVKSYLAGKLGLPPSEICCVAVMPCTGKKAEGGREELQRPGQGRDVDYVLTTHEFGRLLRAKHIPLGSLPEGHFDDPLAEGTGAAVIFGNTGGVMEAALRTAYELATGQPLPRLEVTAVRGLAGIKEVTITLPDSAPAGVAGRQLRVAVASGIAAAQRLLEAQRNGEAHYDFVEVMSCPGGCVGGGGQPKTHDPQALAKRAAAIYSIDEAATIRKSHENPSVQKLYQDFLGQPGSPLAHQLLHTHYTDRSASSSASSGAGAAFNPAPSHLAAAAAGAPPCQDFTLVAELAARRLHGHA